MPSGLAHVQSRFLEGDVMSASPPIIGRWEAFRKRVIFGLKACSHPSNSFAMGCVPESPVPAPRGVPRVLVHPDDWCLGMCRMPEPFSLSLVPIRSRRSASSGHLRASWLMVDA